MISQLVKFEHQLEVTLEGAVVEDDPDPTNWTIVRSPLAALGRTTFQGFATAQQELFPFLPLDRRPPADIGFLLARSFSLVPTRTAHRELFTLAYGKFTTWEGGEFQRPPTSVATVPIPFTETLTPLRWPLLVHELAHWYLPAGESLAERAHSALASEFETDEVPSSIQKAFDEALADLVGYRAFGLSYVLALAVEAYLSAPHETGPEDAIAPSPRRRLTLVASDNPYGVLDALPKEWPLDAGGEVSEDLLIRVSAVASELLSNFTPATPDRLSVQKARTLLSNDQSAGGVHRSEDGVTQDDFRAVLLGGDKATKDRVFLAAVDYPCTDAEILDAAWLLEVDRPAGEILDELKRLRTDPHNLEDAVASVATRDTSVSRSLQTAAVHRWLKEWDSEIRAATESANG